MLYQSSTGPVDFLAGFCSQLMCKKNDLDTWFLCLVVSQILFGLCNCIFVFIKVHVPFSYLLLNALQGFAMVQTAALFQVWYPSAFS